MAADIAHFAVKSIGLSAVNGRKPCTLLDAARHNLRELQAERGASSRIDPTRTTSNTLLQGPASAVEVEALAASMLTAAAVSADKLRRDHCQAIEAVFSLPPDTQIEATGYFTRCLAWLKQSMKLPVLSAVIHCDESTVHLHALLLPVTGGAHVGSAPINRVALKRLRSDFFSEIAGPAGMKRAGAKVRGMVKQWAVDAVLHRCEALGLPAANGSLWSVVVDAIKRDPTPFMLALEIDANSIRPSDKQPQPESTSNPIGIAQNPIGFERQGPVQRTLSCVGIPIESLPELWATVGTRSRWVTESPHSKRLLMARAAQRIAIAASTTRKTPKSVPAPTARIDDDGTTRERDEHAHDLSAWEELS